MSHLSEQDAALTPAVTHVTIEICVVAVTSDLAIGIHPRPCRDPFVGALPAPRRQFRCGNVRRALARVRVVELKRHQAIRLESAATGISAQSANSTAFN